MLIEHEQEATTPDSAAGTAEEGEREEEWEREEEGEEGGRGGKLLTTMQRPGLTIAGLGIEGVGELV